MSGERARRAESTYGAVVRQHRDGLEKVAQLVCTDVVYPDDELASRALRVGGRACTKGSLTTHNQTRWTTAACSMAPNAQVGVSVSEKLETSSRSS